MNRTLKAVRITTVPIESAYGSFRQVRVDDQPVGTYKIVKGGFLPFGKRKVRASEVEAQWAVIHTAGFKLMREGASLLDALKELPL
jgi:hypothetical protein